MCDNCFDPSRYGGALCMACGRGFIPDPDSEFFIPGICPGCSNRLVPDAGTVQAALNRPEPYQTTLF